MDSVLTYVKYGIGCSQTTGTFHQASLVQDLSFDLQQRLAYRINSLLAEEATYAIPKYILAFFIERPIGCADRAAEILSYCDPKAISQRHLSMKDHQANSSCHIC